MRKILYWGLFIVQFFLAVSLFAAETLFQVRGESLTPDGTRISLLWQVRQENNRFSFYLDKQLKAEMILKDGKVVKIQKRVRYAGRDKWIKLSDPLQIRLELRSGFYPFSAMLNLETRGTYFTKMSTGEFQIERRAIK
ncbi:MAG: hypothetical protein GXO70_09190 [Acidobacteria bacterium]|nr:hypothetical protein [Acidobacteriota bacterium]